MRNLGRWFAVVAMSMLGLGPMAWAQGQEITFSAMGDGPYGAGQVPEFQEQLANHNRYSPSAFFVHVGDIFDGGEPCDSSMYASIANIMLSLAVPVYIIPGDNETIDCASPSQALALWKQHFINYEQNFCGATPTTHDSVRPENWAFMQNGVLFIGINMVGGSSPYQDNANWVTEQLQAHGAQVRAAVVLSHIAPTKSTNFSTPFRQAASEFGKPVLFLHGHGHSWSMTYPFPELNILAVQVDNMAGEDPVEVTVTMDTSTPATAFTLKRNPWASATIVNMPPCVNAGPDQFITLFQPDTLIGSASDDGDPNPPAAMTFTWSKVSGPGTVTFGNPNALVTTVSFVNPGNYVLRLTANDSQLQKSDDLTITVLDDSPIISAFNPGSGAPGTEVTINGSYLGNATSVTFNGVTASSLVVDSGTQIRATVPPGATTGKIGVTNAVGTGLSADDFMMQYSLTVNKFGSGNVALDPAGGIYAPGTVVTLTATPAPGYLFSGWSGDLSGSDNPATITMDGTKTVTAHFTAVPIVYYGTKTGGSLASTTVTTSANLTAGNGHLYLAAISMRPKVSVASISGLGLDWTLVKTQCSSHNTTGIEVWKAQGTPSGNGAVTATFASAPKTAVIAVSRYSGTAEDPIGSSLAGNANGVDAGAQCTGGVDSNSYAFDLATTDGAVVYGAIALKARRHIPGAGYTERAEKQQLNGNFTCTVAVEDKIIISPSTVTVDGSFSGVVDWAIVALEIKPKQYTLTVNPTGSGSVTANPVSPSGVYNAGAAVTLTATPAAGFQFTGWNGDLAGTANPATVTMSDNKTITATFIPGNAVVHEETRTGSSSGSSLVQTSESLLGVTDHLYLAAISSQPKRSVSSVTGLGLNWSLLKAQCSGRSTTGVEVWMAQGEPSSDDTVKAMFSGIATNSVIAVSRYSGANATAPIGNILSGNSNGVNAAALCADGIDSDSYSFNLDMTASGAVAYGAAAMKIKTHAPGAGYTERAEVHKLGNSLPAGVAVEDQLSNTIGPVSVNGAFNGAVDWAAVAVEIKPLTLNKKEARAENEKPAAPPAAYLLRQNYPNPFNPSTTIQIELPQTSPVKLTVYNMRGEAVRTLLERALPAGYHHVTFDARGLASGLYFYRLEAGVYKMTRKMILQK